MKFQKMHGAGNDFVLLDLREQDFALNSGIVAALAERHTGIGFDQLLVLREASEAGCLVAFEIWNTDGSRAEQCGNGVRCIGLYLQDRGETPHGVFTLQGPRAVISLEALADSQFRVNMGVPDFNAGHLPQPFGRTAGQFRLESPFGPLELGVVSMGNPHAVLEVDDIRQADVGQLGPFISQNPVFPEGCNAGFVQVIDRATVHLRVFERGAGETRACGSGACAAAAILIMKGKIEQQVLVKQAGGGLIIGWKGGRDAISMTGPAAHVYEGNLL